MKITINGKSHEVDSSVLSYEDICTLAYDRVILGMTCTYFMRNSEGWEKSGTVRPGRPVVLVENAVVDICYTGNA